MFDSETYGDILLFHIYTISFKHPETVMCTMAYPQKQMIAAVSSFFSHDTAYFVIIDDQIFNFLFEMEFDTFFDQMIDYDQRYQDWQPWNADPGKAEEE